jgi:hypothetical protein
MIYKHFPKNDSPRPPRRTGQAGSAPLHEKKECLAKKGSREENTPLRLSAFARDEKKESLP